MFSKSGFVKAGLCGSYKWKLKWILARIRYGNPDKLMEKALKLCQEFDFNTSKYLCRYNRYNRGYRVPRECYESVVLKEFEGYMLPVPVGYDQILTASYGVSGTNRRVICKNRAILIFLLSDGYIA